MVVYYFNSRIVVVILWIALLYGVYRVSQFERDFIEYDPFAVLEIDKVWIAFQN